MFSQFYIIKGLTPLIHHYIFFNRIFFNLFKNAHNRLSLELSKELSIGKVCWQNHRQICGMKMPILLALVTLGDWTQIKMLVFASQHQSK
jgi:hypothetical protein